MVCNFLSLLYISFLIYPESKMLLIVGCSLKSYALLKLLYSLRLYSVLKCFQNN